MWVRECGMQDASLIFISGYKSGCAVVLGSALLLLVKGEGGGSWVRCSVRGSLVSWSPPLSRLRDATPNHMNIYERKLLQLRRFISSGQSCSAAQEVIVLHTILDVSGLNPATVDCYTQTWATWFTSFLQQDRSPGEWKGYTFCSKGSRRSPTLWHSGHTPCSLTSE